MKSKSIILLLVFFILSLSSSSAQRGNCEEITNKKANQLYESASKMAVYNPREAEKQLLTAIQLVPDFPDAYYTLSEIYMAKSKIPEYDSVQIYRNNQAKRTAIQYLEKVIKLCPSYNYYFAYFTSGKYYYDNGLYADAKPKLAIFARENQTHPKETANARLMLKNIDKYFNLINNPVPFFPKPIEGICTSNDEYLPLVSPDGDFIFYTHRYKKINSEYVEELCISSRIWEDSLIERYSVGRPLDKPFNQGYSQGGASITIDNNHLFITICKYERTNYTSYKNCDIYYTDYVDNEWTQLRKMSSNINSNNTFEGQPSITADGEILYFASAREGGYGGLDIYRSVRESDGNWSKAENLGPVINTKGDDKTPFIHSDGRTLYYASNGHFGMGGLDIFYSYYQGNGQWSDPNNMGYPINTTNDELGFTVSADGKKVYFSSKNLAGEGGWDVFSADLHKNARPQQVLLIKGRITDDKGQGVCNASVEMKNIETHERTEGMVNRMTGRYAIAVSPDPNAEYMMIAKKEGHFYSSIYINPRFKKYEPPTTVNLKVTKIEKNEPIRLNNVNFKINSAKLNELSKASIHVLIEFMQENPNIQIALHGHTDNYGEASDNQTLSVLRTKTVSDYIISKGVNKNRISYKGFGESKPIASNSTDAGRATNRRVEFIVK